MKLIKPSYEILTPIDSVEAYKTVETAARTCYKSEARITVGSSEKLCKKLVESGHLAMIEFAPDITVRFISNRAFTHEMVRHRHCSFAQESQRYVKYENKDMEFILPHWLDFDCMGDEDKLEEIASSKRNFIKSCEKAEEDYAKLRERGYLAQDARDVLPNAVKTEICVKANIREWRHIFELRTAKAAHPEMRRLMCPLLDELKEELPIFFEDIEY